MERIPDTPSNAAIRLTGALREGDIERIGSLLCKEITDNADLNIEDSSTLGSLAEFYEARMEQVREGRTAFGGDSQYAPAEQVGLEVDQAWTEIEFIGEDHTEVWRLSMVREAGKWKACSAEFEGVRPKTIDDLRSD